MRTFDQWMKEYGVSHQNPLNQKIHKICVPLITLTVIGFLKLIPTPDFFGNDLNWGILFIILCLSFYLSLNLKMFLAMLVQTAVMYGICIQLDKLGILLSFCVVVFILSWIGQFYGHKVEGKKPSFLTDLVFLLIGPLWVTRFIFKKMGIKI